MEAKDKLRAIRADIDSALEQIAKKHGLETIVSLNATYSASNFTMKIEGVFKGGESKEGQRYNYLRTYTPNLPEIGSTFDLKNETYTIKGTNKTGTKIITEARDSQQYLFSVDYIQLLTTKNTIKK